MAFAISMGTRKRDAELAGELRRVLARRSASVQRILESYGVPTVPIDRLDAAEENSGTRTLTVR